ncbi:MAG: FecR domain-containing protein [Puniceicoccales bacterium]|jgi:hypothetical protein|nr:FecR domain-containing protein [Puniceicoccales bacterium]
MTYLRLFGTFALAVAASIAGASTVRAEDTSRAPVAQASTPGLIVGRLEVAHVRGGMVRAFDPVLGNSLLKRGMVLRPGAVITTDAKAFVHLWMNNGAHVVLMPSSELAVFRSDVAPGAKLPTKDFAKIGSEPTSSNTQLNLSYGRVIVEVRKLNIPQSVFRVFTPFAEASVKGTIFAVEQGEDYARILTVKGCVAAVPLLADLGDKATVDEGKYVVYRRGRGKRFTVDTLSPGEIDKILQELAVEEALEPFDEVRDDERVTVEHVDKGRTTSKENGE